MLGGVRSRSLAASGDVPLSTAGCQTIERSKTGLGDDGAGTAAEFQADRKTVDAVVRNLEVIGEAVKHRPASTVRTWIGERPPASATY